jgi:cytochrome c
MKQRRVLRAMVPLASLAIAGLAGAATDDGALQRGEQVYARCAACHAIESNRTGPQHCGLFGRRAAAAPGFIMYSQALRDSKIVWDARSLDVFLQDPMKAVPGTTMGYAGVKDPKERSDLIAWLRKATRAGQSCKLDK